MAYNEPMLAETKARRMLCTLVLAAVAAVCVWGDKPLPAQPINVNTATVTELQQLPGVGPSIARSIVRHRTRHGPFRRVEELLIIRGISRAKLKRLRPYVRLN